MYTIFSSTIKYLLHWIIVPNSNKTDPGQLPDSRQEAGPFYFLQSSPIDANIIPSVLASSLYSVYRIPEQGRLGEWVVQRPVSPAALFDLPGTEVMCVYLWLRQSYWNYLVYNKQMCSLADKRPNERSPVIIPKIVQLCKTRIRGTLKRSSYSSFFLAVGQGSMTLLLGYFFVWSKLRHLKLNGAALF